MEWINFRHLYAFWAVHRYGGFRKAAERIYVSQSTVSEQVRLLEEYLGETLFERSTRSLHITDRGAALFEHADAIFVSSHAINHIFRDKAESPVDATIRIGLEGGISRNFVSRHILKVLERSPELRIDLVDGSFDELNNLLKSYELDLIFSLDRPRQKDLLTVEHRRIATSPLCLVGTSALVRALPHRGSEQPVELYLFRRPFAGPPLAQTIAEQYGITVEVPVQTDDISLLRFLANGGRGLAVVPTIGVRDDLEAGRVERLWIEDSPVIEVYAVFLQQGHRRQRIEQFLE